MNRCVIGILAHVDAGKTTLAEGILYTCGKLRKLGRVDHQDAFLDTGALERERGITIFSKQAVFPLGDTEVTLLDTPGHADFAAEAERVLPVLDAAILVVGGPDGVQGHTRTLWELLGRYRVPTFLFINKLDLLENARPDDGRDFVMGELKGKLGLTLLKGVSFTSPVAGQTAAFENEDISDTLKQIAKGLEKQKISDITKIDLSDTMDIRITYQNRILMFIGSTAELDYKMSYAKTMLTNQLSSSQEGKLDLSWLVSGNSTVYFSQGSIEIFESGKNENTSSESGQSNGSLASNSETPSSEVSDSSNSSNYSSSSNASSSSIGAE